MQVFPKKEHLLPLKLTHTRLYQGVKNVTFSETFACYMVWDDPIAHQKTVKFCLSAPP